MADGPQLPNLHALGLLDNKGGGSTDELANEDLGKLLEKAPNKLPGTAAKLIEAIPLIGSLLARLIPVNLGEVSVFASLDRKGFIDNPINQGKGGSQGGALANIAGGLMKRSELTDGTVMHFANAGGGGGGGGGGDAGGGGGGDGGGASRYFDNIDAPIISAAAGGQHFDVIDFPRAMLGSLSSPIIGDMGTAGRGAGMDIG